MVLALLVAACGGSEQEPPDTTSEGTGSWDLIASGITEEGVPLDVALQAFALEVGPLPGVDTPAGGGPVPSGTGAVRWTLGHWDELNSEQQEAVTGYLHPSRSSRVGGPVLAVAGLATDTGPDEQALLELIAETEDVIAQNLGRDLGVPIELHVAPDLDDGDGYAYASGTDTGGGMFGPMARCEITLAKTGSQIAADAQAGGDPAPLRSLIAHEIFHCFEMALTVNLVESYIRPSWVVEGLAEWVGETVSGGSAGSGETGWPRWLADPPLSLFAREYSAIGFYAHLQEHGADVWSTIDHIIEGSDESDEAAYVAAIAAAGPDVLPAWGAGVYRDPTRAPVWDQDGPGITPHKYPARTAFPEIGDGSVAQPFATRLGADTWDTELTAQVVTIGGTGFGMVLLPDDAELTLDGTMTEVLCTDPAGCSCPEGSPGASAVFRVTTPGPARIGLTGHLDGTTMTLQGWTLDAFCQNQPEVDECMVGLWQSVSYHAQDQEVMGGTGAGVMLTIDRTGRGSIDFDPMVNIVSRTESGGDLVPWVRVVQTGQAYFDVTPTVEGGLVDRAFGVDYSIRAEVDLGSGFVEAGDEFALTGTGAGPGATLTCDGDTLTWTGVAGISGYEFTRLSSDVDPVVTPPDAVPIDEEGEGGEGEPGGIPEPPPDWGSGIDACLILTIDEIQTYSPGVTQPEAEDDLSTQLFHQCSYLPGLVVQVLPPQPPEFTGDAAQGIGMEVVPIEGIGDWAQAFFFPGDPPTLASVSAGNAAGTVSITPYAQVVEGSPEYQALLDFLAKALCRL